MLKYLKADSKWLSTISVILAIAILLSICFSLSVSRMHGLKRQESKVPTMQVNQSYQSVSLSDLVKVLEISPDKAKEQYLEKNLSIHGKIKQWDSRGVSFTLDTGKKSNVIFNCRVQSEEQRNLVRQCHRNQKVTVKGILTLASAKAGYEIDVKTLTLS